MSDSNPSLQCSVCGKWMRLRGKDKDRVEFQRFYGSCQDKEGNHYSHDKEVCDECCKYGCPYRNKPHQPSEKPKDIVLIYSIRNMTDNAGDKHLYCAEMNGDVRDYHSKEMLIRKAEEEKLPWMVIEFTPYGFKVKKKSTLSDYTQYCEQLKQTT